MEMDEYGLEKNRKMDIFNCCYSGNKERFKKEKRISKWGTGILGLCGIFGFGIGFVIGFIIKGFCK